MPVPGRTSCAGRPGTCPGPVRVVSEGPHWSRWRRRKGHLCLRDPSCPVGLATPGIRDLSFPGHVDGTFVLGSTCETPEMLWFRLLHDPPPLPPSDSAQHPSPGVRFLSIKSLSASLFPFDSGTPPLLPRVLGWRRFPKGGVRRPRTSACTHVLSTRPVPGPRPVWTGAVS